MCRANLLAQDLYSRRSLRVFWHTAVWAVCLASLALADKAQAANWDGVRVLPKSSRVNLLDAPGRGAVVASAAEVEWPAVVRSFDGQWLQIGDASGGSALPERGWVRKGDVLRLDEVQDYCTGRLHALGAAKSAAAGEAYWLRGIYWEQSGEVENAIADFKAARACGLASGDLLFRLGRASTRFAVRKLNFQRGDTDEAFAAADQYFRQAERAYAAVGRRAPPHLYTSWGDARREAYRVTGADADAQAASGHYRKAEELAPHWFLPSQAQGMLMVAIYDRLSAGGQAADTSTLLQAVQCLSQAIRLNPISSASYRERAEALLRLAAAAGPCEEVDLKLGRVASDDGQHPEVLPACSNPSPAAKLAILNEALQSAERAYELGNNREPRSLEVKANVQRALAVAIYPGQPPLEQVLDASIKAKIATAQALLTRASQLAEASANYSHAFDDIDRRLTLASECSDRARRYADFLNGDKLVLIAEAKSKLSRATQEAKQLVKLTVDEQQQLPADSPRRGDLVRQRAAAEQLSAEVASLSTMIGQTSDAGPVEGRRLLNAVTKVEQRVADVHAQAITPGTLEPAPGKPTPAPTADDREQQLDELRNTIEQARTTIARLSEEPASAPHRPTYTPLFLGAE